MNIYLKAKNYLTSVNYKYVTGVGTQVPLRLKWWYKVRYGILKFKHLNFGCNKYSVDTYNEIRNFIVHGTFIDIGSYILESGAYEYKHYDDVDGVDEFVEYWIMNKFDYLV